MLLDSGVRLKSLVSVQNVLVNQVRNIPGQLPPIFNPNGAFIVAGIRHMGDTRGNDWQTEITTVTPDWAKLQAVST